MSANVESVQKGGTQRPSSEVLAAHYKSPEAEAIDRWFEDLSYYERTLEQMARAKLDENFREELKHIEQWFNVLSDPERTTALYSLLQHTNQVQIRFFITVLQQMAQKDPAVSTPTAKTPSTPGVPTPGVSTPGVSGGPGPAPGLPHAGPPRVPSPAVSVGGGIPSSMRHIAEGDEDEKYLGIVKGNRRLYDRHSAPNADEKFAQYLGDLRVVPDDLHRTEQPGVEYVLDDYPSYKRASRTSVTMSPIIRPKTPLDGDAINSADWSLNPSPATPSLGNGTFSPVILPRQVEEYDVPI
ncbi:hypothetical protein HK097_004938, partial [Rhizophlyctis rosea]